MILCFFAIATYNIHNMIVNMNDHIDYIAKPEECKMALLIFKFRQGDEIELAAHIRRVRQRIHGDYPGMCREEGDNLPICFLCPAASHSR